MSWLKIAVLAACLGASGKLALAAPDAPAKDATVVGYLIKVQTAPDGKSATATLLVKGKKIDIFIKDELTLNKFRIKKIQNDDEIRCKYHSEDGKNLSDSFKRTAGC